MFSRAVLRSVPMNRLAFTYNTATSACEKGAQRSIITYDAATGACEKGKQWQQALVRLDMMLGSAFS